MFNAVFMAEAYRARRSPRAIRQAHMIWHCVGGARRGFSRDGRARAANWESFAVFEKDFEAFLFDMDGTVLSSIASAERAWTVWALRHGLDVTRFLPTIHGVRSIDTIRWLALPNVDPALEAARITQSEIDNVEGVVPIAGAAAFLASLPAARWAIATSAPRALAERRLQAAGLPAPAVVICAEDVENGKPAPDAYLLAARRLGCDVRDCLVFEDAPAGVQAAEAAGAAVVVVTETHRHPLATPHPAMRDYRGLSVQVTRNGWLRLAASDARA
jgi:sugar-phosphatase